MEGYWSIEIESTKEQVTEEQGGFRSGKGCIDQIFVLKQLVEKYIEKRKELHFVFKKPGEGVW